MTDHANELRRHARKIPHPQGETPGVMLRAADEIERLRSESSRLHKEADKFEDGIDWVQRALQAEAQVEAMERQGPVGTALLCTRCSTPFDGDHYCPACGYHTATEENVYALPGAKGEEK